MSNGTNSAGVNFTAGYASNTSITSRPHKKSASSFLRSGSIKTANSGAGARSATARNNLLSIVVITQSLNSASRNDVSTLSALWTRSSPVAPNSPIISATKAGSFWGNTANESPGSYDNPVSARSISKCRVSFSDPPLVRTSILARRARQGFLRLKTGAVVELMAVVPYVATAPGQSATQNLPIPKSPPRQK